MSPRAPLLFFFICGFLAAGDVRLRLEIEPSFREQPVPNFGYLPSHLFLCYRVSVTVEGSPMNIAIDSTDTHCTQLNVSLTTLMEATKAFNKLVAFWSSDHPKHLEFGEFGHPKVVPLKFKDMVLTAEIPAMLSSFVPTDTVPIIKVSMDPKNKTMEARVLWMGHLDPRTRPLYFSLTDTEWES